MIWIGSSSPPTQPSGSTSPWRLANQATENGTNTWWWTTHGSFRWVITLVINGISGGKSSTYNSGELTHLRFVGWTTKYLIKIRWFGDSGIVLPIFYVSWKDHLWMRNCSLPRLPEAQNHPKFPWQFGWNFPQALVSWQKFPIFRKQMKVSMAMGGTSIVGWFRIKEKIPSKN